MIQYSRDDFNIDQLGSFYSRDKTVFRVFAPEHDTLFLLLEGREYAMHKEHYTFEAEVSGDLEGKGYRFRTGDGVFFRDPFAYLSIDDLSIILDAEKFHDEKISPAKNEDVIVYEASVRDFSSDPSYTGHYPRKFLALAEEGLRKDDYYVLGFDYLKNIGVTHLQLLPILAFDLDHSEYNWGYNPVAFNHLQKDYVYDDDDLYAYINEFRDVVNRYHRNDIRIVMDVVFNHVYDVKTFDIEKMIPGHFLRRKADGRLAAGTLCGSEIKSEDPFVRAYLIHMAKRYVQLFDIDGLRMDLMGIIDIDTMNEMRSVLTQMKDDFIIYGEGWNMGDVLPEDQRAAIINADRIKGIAMFNDRFRDSVISYIEGDIYNDVPGVLSAINDYLDHFQSVNYVECHDGYTFYDRLKHDRAYESEEVTVRKCKMALALVIFARGIPFIHAGQEFLRTKKGVRNSYNRADDINRIDWNLRVRNNDICDYLKDLISTRKQNEVFRKNDTYIRFERYYDCLIYHLDSYMVFINPGNSSHIYSDGNEHQVIFDTKGCCDYRTDEIAIPAYSVILCRF